ncbi:MAG: adenylate/guanylate cyclase domain-containing protein [Nitrosopumilus sp.]
MNTFILNSKKRVKKAIDANFEYHHLALSRSKKFLRKHDSDRLPLFVLYVDLVGSTKMSVDLSPKTLNVIIRTFSQEMSYVVEDFNGYILKFVGDAVLAYFPYTEKSGQADSIIKCAKTMHQIIDKAINPILEEDGFPKLKIKVTVDFGNCSVVRYGADKYLSHMDLIGLTLNLASKMQSYAKPDQIIIGKSVFTKLRLNTKKLFKKKQTDRTNWIFHQLKTEKPYSIYYSI